MAQASWALLPLENHFLLPQVFLYTIGTSTSTCGNCIPLMKTVAKQRRDGITSPSPGRTSILTEAAFPSPNFISLRYLGSLGCEYPERRVMDCTQTSKNKPSLCFTHCHQSCLALHAFLPERTIRAGERSQFFIEQLQDCGLHSGSFYNKTFTYGLVLPRAGAK